MGHFDTSEDLKYGNLHFPYVGLLNIRKIKHWCQMVTLVGERYDHFRIEQNTVKAFFQKCLYHVFSIKSKESSIYNQILLRFNILVIYQV
jgi:hypothetical protein